jgi:hypothetical protein
MYLLEERKTGEPGSGRAGRKRKDRKARKDSLKQDLDNSSTELGPQRLHDPRSKAGLVVTKAEDHSALEDVACERNDGKEGRED